MIFELIKDLVTDSLINILIKKYHAIGTINSFNRKF